MNSHGKVSDPAARDTVTFPSSSGLAHYLQSGSMKFREFVQKKESIMGKTHLSGSRLSGASQEAGVRNGVMWAPRRAG
jgi:hypothetical protein